MSGAETASASVGGEVFRCAQCRGGLELQEAFDGLHSYRLCAACRATAGARQWRVRLLRLLWVFVCFAAVADMMDDRPWSFFDYPPHALFIWLVMAGVAVPHELGHVVAGWLVGIKTRRVQLGSGPKLARFAFFGTDWEIRLIPGGGLAYVFCLSPRLYRFRIVFSALGGIGAELLLLACVFAAFPPERVLSYFFGQGFSVPFDLFLGIALGLCWSVWPRRFLSADHGVTPNDTLIALNALFLSRQEIRASLADALNYEGWYQWTEGHIQAAERAFHKALQWDPRNSLCAHHCAIAKARKGLTKEAEAAWRELLRWPDLNPVLRAAARNALASEQVERSVVGPLSSEQRENLLREAETLSNEVYANAPWIPTFRSVKGAVLVARGRYEEGLTLLRQSIDAETDPAAQAWDACWAAWAAAGTGRAEEARHYLAVAKKTDPQSRLIAWAESRVEASPSVGRQDSPDGPAGPGVQPMCS